MGGGGGEGGGGGVVSSHSRELDQTPTWAVATVCAVIVLLSIILEKVLHKVGEWFTERRKMALYEALEKVKAELMVLGFISLLLTFGQNYIARVCIPLRYADTMLPCPYRETRMHNMEPKDVETEGEQHHRRLLWNERRFLGGHGEAPACKAGYEPLISLNGLHQLHIFIFFLAVFHVVYSAVTMLLGRLKIRGWKEWEKEALSRDADPSKFRLTHETSFVRSHTSFWTKNAFLFVVACFFRQFFRSVRRADYLTLRHGFITVHLAPGSKFNFQKYIKRSLEDDFKVVVGISPILWASVVLFLLLNVNGWQAMFWISIIPLIIILALGVELQAIITKMALEIQERHAVVQGIPLVQVTDSHFWFGWPQLVLYLIHLTLFQNAFQITYFLWIWYEFGLTSCFHENYSILIIRVLLGIGVQIMCSYITLPLYALVTQMGSNMKKSIFDEHTNKALKSWHLKVKKKTGGGKTGRSPTKTLGGSPNESSTHSPMGQPLHHFKTTGHLDEETSDIENRTSTTNLISTDDHTGVQSGTREQQHNQDANRDLLTGP